MCHQYTTLVGIPWACLTADLRNVPEGVNASGDGRESGGINTTSRMMGFLKGRAPVDTEAAEPQVIGHPLPFEATRMPGLRNQICGHWSGLDAAGRFFSSEGFAAEGAPHVGSFSDYISLLDRTPGL